MSESKKVVLVGAGALGSHLALLLRNEDVHLKVVDFDTVESKNTQSQLHPRSSVGKRKVESLKQTLNFLFGFKIEAVSSRLTEDNVDVLLKDADLVVDAVDNAETRRLIQGYVKEHKIPCLHGALAPGGAFGRVIWTENFVPDEEAGAGAATCENGEHLPFIGLTASYTARAVQVFLRTGKKVGFSVSPGGAVVV